MYSFTYVWPYIGLGAAGLLALLLLTDNLRSDKSVSRWKDLVWLTWTGTLAYLIHQFEEHGIDVTGAPYAFRGSLCASVGFADAGNCRIPFSFITAVNVAAIWLAGPAAALLGRRWPVLALAFFSIPFVNALAHIAPMVGSGHYNPGVVTAIVLFLPLSLWTFHVAIRGYGLGWRAVTATVFAGVVLHAVLMGSLRVYLGGHIDVVTLDVIQILNPALGGLIVLALGRRATHSA
jgi:hypothetical protein